MRGLSSLERQMDESTEIEEPGEPAERAEPDQAAASSAMLVDLTPGALMCGTVDGEMEQFDSIGELLDYLLSKCRTLESGGVPHGDFLAGYSDDGTRPQRDPTEADSASARRM